MNHSEEHVCDRWLSWVHTPPRQDLEEGTGRKTPCNEMWGLVHKSVTVQAPS